MILNIVALIQHQLKCLDDCLFEDDVICLVALNYLSTESVDSPLPLYYGL